MPAYIVVFLIASGFNWTKAVHIDDAAYLEVAEHVSDDPVHGLRRPINWDGSPRPAHALNQPPLVSYFLALVLILWGDGDLALHVAYSSFTLLSLVGFARLETTLTARPPGIFGVAIFGLGAALLPSQNLMTDVPMLGFALHALAALLKPAPKYGLAGAHLALACLAKYTALAVLPPVACFLLARGEWRRGIWALATPALALLGWSAFNVWDYGGIHLLGRPMIPLTLARLCERALALTICIGAVAPFSLLLLPQLHQSSKGPRAVVVIVSLSLALFVHGLLRWRDPLTDALLRASFLGIGGVLIASLGYALSRIERRTLASPRGLLLIVAASSLLFIVVLAPFIAVRHALLPLALAQIALLANPSSVLASGLQSAVVAAHVLLGVWLAASDHSFAEVYRRSAPMLARSTAASEVTFIGHWGWQWYGKRSGMRHLSQDDLSRLPPGSVIIVPALATLPWEWKQPAGVTLTHEFAIPSSAFTALRIMSPSTTLGFYHSTARALPWAFDMRPVERFRIFSVGPPRARAVS